MKKTLISLMLVLVSMTMTGCFTLIESIASTYPAHPTTTVITSPTPTVTTTVTRPSTPTTTIVVNQTPQATYDYYRSLDLRAVAAAFAESRTVREFEQLLNSSRYMVSNLDLNRDGWIDYLRVMETMQGWTHVLYVQAVLGANVFQNVATVIVETNYGSRYVQIVGDPFIYGPNYYIDPVFRSTPPMYAHMCSHGYSCWTSPYYWNSYPSYYGHTAPVYHTHYEAYVTTYVSNHSYCREVHYGTSLHNPNYHTYGGNISRDDYAVQNPQQSFTRNYTQVNAQPLTQTSTRTGSTSTTSNTSTTSPTSSTSSRTGSTSTTSNTSTTNTTSSTSTRTGSTSTTSQTSTTSSSSTRQPSATTTTAKPSNSTTVTTRVQSSGRQQTTTTRPSTPSKTSTTTPTSKTTRTSSTSTTSTTSRTSTTSSPSRTSTPSSTSRTSTTSPTSNTRTSGSTRQ